MADLEQEFQKAAKDVGELKVRPTDQELLNIYGLYKQAIEGDCDQPKPGMFYLKEKAKHESWSSRKGKLFLMNWYTMIVLLLQLLLDTL